MPTRRAEPQRSNGRTLSILVAEDFADNRVLVEAYLKGSTHTITFAHDGRQALERFMVGRFDLVLMDIQMPVMDGLEATRAIRAFEARDMRTPMPIIAFTANARPEDIETTRAAGCTAHLSKPVSKRVLLETIERVTAGAGDDVISNNEMPHDNIHILVPEGLRELAPGYLEARRRDVERGAALLECNDFDGLKQMGHKMAGSGTSYGFLLLTELGRSLEQSAETGDSDLTEQHLCAMRDYLQRVQLCPPSPVAAFTGQRSLG